MPAVIRVLDEAIRSATLIRRRLGDELRDSRLRAGLSQTQVAAVLRCSPATISRAERGLVRDLTVEYLARHAASVGLVLRVNLFPAGSPMRDAGQLRVLNRLESNVSEAWDWVVEMVVGPGDLRAFDAGARKPGCRIGIDVWARVRDVQARRARVVRSRSTRGWIA